MSVLAVIKVVKCDVCKMITTLMTKEEYQKFADEWISAEPDDFCPECNKTMAELISIQMEKNSSGAGANQ